MTVLQGAAANFGCGWYYVHTAFFISISYIIVIPLDVAGAMCAQRLRNKMLMLTAKSITAATCVVTAAIALDICAGMAFTPLPFPLGMVCAVVVFGRLPLKLLLITLLMHGRCRHYLLVRPHGIYCVTPLPFPLSMVCAVALFGRLTLAPGSATTTKVVTTARGADARSVPLLSCYYY